MKRQVLALAASGLLSFALISGAQAQNLAVINGKAVPITQYDQVLQQIQKSGQPVTEQIKERLKKELITREVLLQAAEAAGVTKLPDYQRDLESAKDAIAINLFMKSKMDSIIVTDAEAQSMYDKFVKTNSDKEYKAEHILVPTEKEAEDIIAKLNKDQGKNFAALAKKYSKDTGTASKGGELGWASPNNYVPEFSAALEKLKKGAYSAAPVKTQFGYHIIKLEDTRPVALPKFDAVKAQIIMQIKQQKISELQAELVKKAKVE